MYVFEEGRQRQKRSWAFVWVSSRGERRISRAAYRGKACGWAVEGNAKGGAYFVGLWSRQLGQKSGQAAAGTTGEKPGSLNSWGGGIQRRKDAHETTPVSILFVGSHGLRGARKVVQGPGGCLSILLCHFAFDCWASETTQTAPDHLSFLSTS
eukprot:1156292-Pelagomonas_calceolata.AAC.3